MSHSALSLQHYTEAVLCVLCVAVSGWCVVCSGVCTLLYGASGAVCTVPCSTQNREQTESVSPAGPQRLAQHTRTDRILCSESGLPGLCPHTTHNRHSDTADTGRTWTSRYQNVRSVLSSVRREYSRDTADVQRYNVIRQF